MLKIVDKYQPAHERAELVQILSIKCLNRTNKLYFLTGLGGGNTANSTEIPASTGIPAEEDDNVEDDESESNQEEDDNVEDDESESSKKEEKYGFLNERKTNKILKTNPVQ